MQLATSFDDAFQYMRIAGRNTLPRTRNNVGEALKRGIPLRVGHSRCPFCLALLVLEVVRDVRKEHADR